MPKYSIILPVYDGEKYIKSAIDSVLSLNYTNFEFIISNNCSTDGTEKILMSISDPRVKIIKPNKTLPLGAHWNFAIEHATGEWLWALGADDAIMPYFFELCDKLVKVCEQHDINVIKSNRAYYFWPGYEDVYKDAHINYGIENTMEIKNLQTLMADMLSGKASYFDLPQMYISSLFNRSVIEKAKKFSRTNEIIPYDVPAQDAYLGLLACIFEKKYLFTNIPLGWVGTSPSSMTRKLYNNSLHYKDCSLSQLAAGLKNLQIYMYLAFQAFFENSTYESTEYLNFLDKQSFFPTVYKIYYKNIPDTDETKKAFFDFANDNGISKNEIIPITNKLERKEFFRNRITNLFLYRKISSLFQRLKRKLNKNNNYEQKNFSLVFTNKIFLSYKEINTLLSYEGHISSILDNIKLLHNTN
nr:glycosyltransferase family 2 protein [uncultured Treponema sp.]